MDGSPMVFGKRKTRLSLTNRNKDTNSPKTPSRLRTSPARVDTPPNATRSKVGQSASHSTPLNRYKRTCFAEESPSQDYDSDPPAPLPCSQADFAHIIDVDWQWEKQCPNIAKSVRNNTRQPRRIETSRPAPPVTRPATRQLPQKSFPPRSPESDQKKGFYKFKEELMQNLQNTRDSGGSSPLLDFEQFDELDSSLKENDTKNFICDSNIRKRVILNGIVDEKISGGKKETETKKIIEMKIANEREIERRQQPVKTQNSSQSIETKSVSKPTLKTSTVPRPDSKTIVEPAKQTIDANFLDDSDDDDLLILCSQIVEEQINRNVVNPKLKAISKESAFENDSFDDIFLSIPDDDKLFQSIPAGQTNQCRSPLVRYNSMPAKSPSAATKRPPDEKTGNSGFSRHNSMPVSDKQIVKTAESATSVKRLCTAEEIKKKKLEAIQKLEANRRKAALQKTATNSEANKIKSSLLNSNNVKT